MFSQILHSGLANQSPFELAVTVFVNFELSEQSIGSSNRMSVERAVTF